MEDAALTEHLASLLSTPECLSSLVNDGYTVVQNALNEKYAHTLLKDMKTFEANGDFLPNQVQFTIPGRPEPIVATKPGVFEIDLHDESKRLKSAAFGALFEGNAFVHALQPIEKHLAARDSTTNCGPADSTSTSAPPTHTEKRQQPVRLEPGPNGKTIKLQVNTGGAFPLHYDNPGRPNRRRWTCLVYLNRDWAPGDGGELVLVPFGAAPSGVTIQPKFNTLVVFRSDLLLHRVLTSNRPRYCFTVWLDAHSSDVNVDRDVFLKQRHLELPFQELVKLLHDSPLQRVISRAVYADVYEDSLRMCIRGSGSSKKQHSSHEQVSFARICPESRIN